VLRLSLRSHEGHLCSPTDSNVSSNHIKSLEASSEVAVDFCGALKPHLWSS
jgi:hypothetical protein